MKKRKKLLLSLNKSKVSELNTLSQHQIWGGTGPTYECGNAEPTEVNCASGWCQTQGNSGCHTNEMSCS